MIRWLTARLYRKLILSHVGMLVFLFFLLMIGASVAYRFHIRDLTQQRFSAQTQIIFKHLQEELQALSGQVRSKGTQAKVDRVGRGEVAIHSQSLGHPFLALLCQRIQESSLILQAMVSVEQTDRRCLMEAYPGTFRLYGVQANVLLPEVCRKVLSHPAVPSMNAVSSGSSAEYPLSPVGSPSQSMYREGRVRLLQKTAPCFYLEHRKKHRWWRDLIFTNYTYKHPTQPLQMTYILHPRFRRVGPLPLLWIAFFVMLVVGIALLTIPIARNITRPLQGLMAGVHKIQQGDLQHPIVVQGHDEINQLSQAVEEMRQSLLLNRQQRRALIADISHEIRTPLSRIRTVSESVADGLMREPEPLTQAMEGICKQVDEIDQLLGDLLDIARLEISDPGQLSYQPLQLADMLQDMTRTLGPAARAEQQEIVVGSLPDSLPTVEADVRRIRQVLNNLLQNAIRYSPPGSTITLSVREEDVWLRCEVSDQGPGIPEQEREKIFERLYRLDASRSRRTGGQGLGLAIAKQIIIAHHGEIGVASNPTGGSCFWFRLPLRRERSIFTYTP